MSLARFTSSLRVLPRCARLFSSFRNVETVRDPMYEGEQEQTKEERIDVYCQLLSNCTVTGAKDRALILFRDISRLTDDKPRALHYVFTISACERGGDSEKALELLDTMISEGLNPKIYGFNAGISACHRSGQWKQGLALLKKMQNECIVPNEYSYRKLILSCCEANRWEEALSLYYEMKREGLEVSAGLYECLCTVCSKNGQTEFAEKLQAEVRKSERKARLLKPRTR